MQGCNPSAERCRDYGGFLLASGDQGQYGNPPVLLLESVAGGGR